MEKNNVNSRTRIIEIYELLRNNESLNIVELARRFNRHEEIIKKDIRYIRNAISPDMPGISYDRENNVYKIDNDEGKFSVCLTLLTMLYGSRSVSKQDLNQLKAMILKMVSDHERIQIRKITDSYDVSYIPMINVSILDCIGDLYDCIRHQIVMNVTYTYSELNTKSFAIAPLSITFDEGFFYVIAYKNVDSDQPLIRNYRIDRIQDYNLTKQTFNKPQNGNNFFEAGKYSNHSFMMHSGDSVIHATIKVEPWLSQYLKPKFPLHQFLRVEEDKEVYQVTISDEDSLLFWLLKQRTWAEVLSPQNLRNKLKFTIAELARKYGVDLN